MVRVVASYTETDAIKRDIIPPAKILKPRAQIQGCIRALVLREGNYLNFK
jgi:hypothetical protein